MIHWVEVIWTGNKPKVHGGKPSLASSVQYLKNVGYATVGNSNVREFGLDWTLNK